MPVVSLEVARFRPHHGITLPLEHDDMCAGTMAMRLLIGAHGKFRNMSRHHVVCDLEHDTRATCAAGALVFQLKRSDVLNEIAFPEPLCKKLALAAEEIILAGVTVLENKVAIRKIDILHK